MSQGIDHLSTTAGQRNIYFNAPAFSTSDISKYPGLYEVNERGEFTDELRKEGKDVVMARKGWFTPETTFPKEWTVQLEPDEPEEGESANAFLSRLVDLGQIVAGDARLNFARGVVQLFNRSNASENTINLLPGNSQYGFRFMYNPPMINYSLGIAAGINPSYVFGSRSGAQSMPIFSVGSQLSLDLVINRVEDVAFLRGIKETEEADFRALIQKGDGPYSSWVGKNLNVTSQVLPPEEGDNAEDAPVSTTYNTSVVGTRLGQLLEIRNKGTLHDLEYLFRSMLGRRFLTAYRGETADIGIATGQVLVLYLSPSMVYRVRVSAFNYTHKIFTPDMIPTFTEVSLTFDRVPDALKWDDLNDDAMDRV
jgi:hypothetical protein